MPVLRVMRPARFERWEDGVLVMSIDRLAAALRDNTGTRRRPAFLAPDP